MSRVIHLRQSTGCPSEINIMRPSVWGNPFVIGRDGSRKTVIQKFETWIRSRPDLLSCLVELRGKTLVCCCKPKACHGDVLVKLLGELS